MNLASGVRKFIPHRREEKKKKEKKRVFTHGKKFQPFASSLCKCRPENKNKHIICSYLPFKVGLNTAVPSKGAYLLASPSPSSRWLTHTERHLTHAAPVALIVYVHSFFVLAMLPQGVLSVTKVVAVCRPCLMVVTPVIRVVHGYNVVCDGSQCTSTWIFRSSESDTYLFSCVHIISCPLKPLFMIFYAYAFPYHRNNTNRFLPSGCRELMLFSPVNLVHAP